MKVKISKTELNSLKVQAMLAGMQVEELMRSYGMVPSDEEVELDIEDDEAPIKKDKKTKKAKTAEVDVDDAPKKDLYKVPELPQFEKLNRELTLNVNYAAHDIKYKEQYWGIPARTVEYSVAIVKNKKTAADIAKLFAKKSDVEIAKTEAENGETRYFTVVYYGESIPKNVREIAYIKVTEQCGKYHTQMYIKSKALKESHANPDVVKKDISAMVKSIAA